MQNLFRSPVCFAFCVAALAACGSEGSNTDNPDPCDPSLQQCGGGGSGGTFQGGAGGNGGLGGAGTTCNAFFGCGPSQFCDFPSNSCGFASFLVAPSPSDEPDGLGAPKPSGVCVDLVQVCDDNFEPVCGCDGQTYSNDCERRKAGVLKATEGKCDAQVISVGQGEACGSIGGRNPLVCDKGLFCEAPANQCPMPGARGTCQAAPQICTTVNAPVCGCDGKTYQNDCARRSQRQSLANVGACGPSAAKIGEECGAPLARSCERGLVCDPRPNQCKNAKFVGVCRPPSVTCSNNFSPVCGCDGLTYANDCDRHASGVAIEHDGECKNTARGLLEAGIWGAPHIELAVKDPRDIGFLQFDCGHAEIAPPLEVDGAGNFTWQARYVLTGGPDGLKRVSPLSRDAIITGSVSGKEMKLNMQIAGTTGLPWFVLTLGVPGSFNFCL